MARNFYPYGRQSIDEDDIAAVTEVLRSDFLTTGPKVDEFEKALAKTTGAAHAVVCGNGTQALHLALMSLDISEGDYMIVPTITFLATANAVRMCGAEVIFADVDPTTGLLTAETLQQAYNKAPDKKAVKAVIPVHLGGQSCEMAEIKAMAQELGIKILADSCHALGATYKNSPVGSCKYEDLSVFSFHPVKAIAMGEGGAITTNDAKKAERMRRLRSHSMVPTPEAGPWAYEMPEVGYNYRQTDILCALGLSQLKKLSGFLKKRQALANQYDALLKSITSIKPPVRAANCESAWHLYAPRFDFRLMKTSRADLMNKLKEKGIGTQVHYIPVHTQPYYKYRYGEQTLSGAQVYYESTLSLPLYPALTENDVSLIVETLQAIIGGKQ